MRQEAFVARHAAEWDAFEHWLDARESSPRRARATRREWNGLADEDMAHVVKAYDVGQLVIKLNSKLVTAQSDNEVRLTELNLVEGDVVDLETLRAAGLLNRVVKSAKIIASGEVTRALTIRGLGVTKGARAAIEAAGGKIED